MTTTSITGVTTLVTGGGSGIGFGAAARLVADGAHVTICGRTEDKLVAAVDELSPMVGEGGSIRHVAADITVEEEITAAVAAASEPTGLGSCCQLRRPARRSTRQQRGASVAVSQ